MKRIGFLCGAVAVAIVCAAPHEAAAGDGNGFAASLVGGLACRNALRDGGIIPPAGCLRCTAAPRVRSKLLLDAGSAGVEWLPLV